MTKFIPIDKERIRALNEQEKDWVLAKLFALLMQTYEAKEWFSITSDREMAILEELHERIM